MVDLTLRKVCDNCRSARAGITHRREDGTERELCWACAKEFLESRKRKSPETDNGPATR